MLLSILIFLIVLEPEVSHASHDVVDCDTAQIPCYRFDYSNHANFVASFQDYANSPRTHWPDVLKQHEFESSKISCDEEKNLIDLKNMLVVDDKLLWSIGWCMINRKMDRYEVFLMEQYFIRLHIPLNRQDLIKRISLGS